MGKAKTIYSELALQHRTQPPALTRCGRDSEAGGKASQWGEKRKVAEPPGSGEIDLRHPCDWLGAHIRLSLIGPTCSQNKNEGSCELLIKSRPSGANSYRSYSLASWSVTKHSNVASCKPDFQRAGFPSCLLQIRRWISGQVATGYGSERCFYIGSGRFPFVYSVSHIWFKKSTLRYLANRN